MNEDAFARRFYADRSELEALGIQLSRRQAGRRARRAGELLAAAGELPPAGDRVRRRRAGRPADRADAARRRVRLRRAAAARAAADLLGPPEPAAGARAALDRARHHRLAPAATTSRSGWRRSRRRSSAARRSSSTTTRCSATSSARARSTPTSCCSRAASSTSSAARTSASESASSASRASAARSPTRRRPSTTSSARAEFDPRAYANRIQWQFGDPVGTAEVRIAGRIAWQIERHFGRHGEMRPARRRGRGDDRVFVDRVRRRAAARRLGARPRRARAPARPAASSSRSSTRASALLVERHRERAWSWPRRRAPAAGGGATASDEGGNGRRERAAIRPERFARLVTLASILIQAGRARPPHPRRRGARAAADQPSRSCEEDIGVLNVVNFGAGSYVLYAEVQEDGMIEVDPEAYGDSFARPARLLPVEAKALVAAIDLIGEHIPEGSLASVREKVVAALGEDPIREGLQVADRRRRRLARRARPSRARSPSQRLLAIEYYKENEDEFSERTRRALRADQRPRGLVRRLLRPREGGRAPLPPRPHQGGDGHRRALRAAPRGRPGRRRRRLAAHRRGARLAPRARVDLARARALGARGAHRRRGAGRRRADRRAELRRRRLARARGPQGGRRRRRARARGRARGGPRPPPRASPRRSLRAREPPRPDPHGRGRAGGVPRRAAHRRRRDERPRRLAAPDAALVRRPRRRAVGVDVREDRRRSRTSSATRA